MNPLTEAREDALQALAQVPGLTAYDHVPDRLSAGNAAVVVPADPYVEQGQTLGTFKVSLQVILLTPAGTNKVVTKSLDELIVAVVEAFRNDWGISAIGEPGYWANLDNRLGVPFTITSIYQ